MILEHFVYVPNRYYEQGADVVHEINTLLEHYKMKTQLSKLPGKLMQITGGTARESRLAPYTCCKLGIHR